MLMIGISLLLFFIAAVFGALVLTSILKNQKPARPLVFVHGVVALFGLAGLIAYTFIHPDRLLIVGDALLVTAAFGGFTLLAMDLKKNAIPKAFAIGHPLLASCGLIVVLVYFYQQYFR